MEEKEKYKTACEEEPSIVELVQSMEEHLGRPRHIRFSMDVEDLETRSKKPSITEGNVGDGVHRAKEKLRLHQLKNRQGFSRSLNELSTLKSNTAKKSVIQVDDQTLYTKHLELLDNARKKFKEIDTKYTQVSSDLPHSKVAAKGRSLDDVSFPPEHKTENQQEDLMSTLRSTIPAQNDKNPSCSLLNDSPSGVERESTPSLSKLSSFEESVDSAFDFEDGELSKASSTPPSLRSPSSLNNRSFTYNADTVDDKSDKDSGISTDRPYRSRNDPYVPKHFTERFQNWRYRRTLSAIELRETPRTHISQIKKYNTVDEPGNVLKEELKRREKELDNLRRHISLESGSNERLSQKSILGFHHSRSGFQQKAKSSIEEESDSEDECSNSYSASQILTPDERYTFAAQKRGCRTSVCSYYSQQSDTQLNRPREVVRPRWTSVPSIPTYFQNVETKVSRSGTVIPVGTEEKKHRKKHKFGRRSGLYILNDSTHQDTKKKTPKRKSYKPKSKNKKKDTPLDVTGSLKRSFDNTTAVSKPLECQCIGRIVQIRRDIDMAHQIELERHETRPFGFFIQRGYKHFKEGIFVSRMMDRTAEKFLTGLLGIGDEILDINGVTIKDMKVLEVHELISQSQKLLLTVLPFLARKDW